MHIILFYNDMFGYKDRQVMDHLQLPSSEYNT